MYNSKLTVGKYDFTEKDQLEAWNQLPTEAVSGSTVSHSKFKHAWDKPEPIIGQK